MQYSRIIIVLALIPALLLVSACATGEAERIAALEATIAALSGEQQEQLRPATVTPYPSPTPPSTVVPSPEPTEVVAPTPSEVVPPTPATAAAVPPETEAQNWGEICQPSPEEEGQLVANLNMGTTVELKGHLYVKSFSMIREGMMPFTLREFPYGEPDTNWSEACLIHVFIPIGSGPNHVIELADKFEIGDVVVWDTTGREIRGWQRNLDSFRVRLVGVVIETYGEETGLGGSNTIRLQEVELLES